MAFCENCGAKLEDGMNVCPLCGAKSGAYSYANNGGVGAGAFSIADHTAEFDPKDIEENKLITVFSYISWLVLIPLFAYPNSKFARFHANQGFNLAVVATAWNILWGIITAALSIISFVVGMIGIFFLSIGNMLFFAFAIWGIVNVVTGKAKDLPVLSMIKIF